MTRVPAQGLPYCGSRVRDFCKLSDLTDAISEVARLLDDPDRIAAIRIDKTACMAELDIEPRPVNPRRLN